jgi:hypothetical protein
MTAQLAAVTQSRAARRRVPMPGGRALAAMLMCVSATGVLAALTLLASGALPQALETFAATTLFLLALFLA